MKDYRNTWSIKNPKYNLSKDQIRQTISTIGLKFGYNNVFGTVENWEFNDAGINVIIENLGIDVITSGSFKDFCNNVVSEYSKKSGKHIKFEIAVKTQSYEDYNVSKFYYSNPMLKLKFIKQ